ncbi:MAG: hypothetical protein ACE5Q4_04705 [Nitrosopumilus sp.]|jgi:hypothetical protein
MMEIKPIQNITTEKLLKRIESHAGDLAERTLGLKGNLYETDLSFVKGQIYALNFVAQLMGKDLTLVLSSGHEGVKA